jgi:hypothetical protein
MGIPAVASAKPAMRKQRVVVLVPCTKLMLLKLSVGIYKYRLPVPHHH